MVNKKICGYLILFASSFFLWSCSEEEEPAGMYKDISSWIKSEMDVFYYWNSTLPDNQPGGEIHPYTYFYSLLYHEDEFSWITDDAEALANDLQGVSVSTGFSPAFGRLNDSDRVFIAVEFVYENSPADNAGLDRGDIIVAIDGRELTLDNYQDLYNQSSYEATLGDYDGSTVVSTGETVILSATSVEKNPVLLWDVFENNGLKIGYLAFAEFIDGENNRWIEEMVGALQELEGEGVDELIVDLRYNPGGQIGVAGALASAIAPKEMSDTHEELVTIAYNPELEEFFTETEGADSENLVYRFPSTSVNLDLDKAVFLTTSGTASASELLIIGLEPYMEVIQIGEPTVGKYYGSFVITDENTPPQHNYAIMPLVLKYKNAAGFTDFIDGLEPDYAVDDNLLSAEPLGSLSDPIIASAVEVLSGELPDARIKPVPSPYEKLPFEERLRRGNILYD